MVQSSMFQLYRIDEHKMYFDHVKTCSFFCLCHNSTQAPSGNVALKGKNKLFRDGWSQNIIPGIHFYCLSVFWHILAVLFFNGATSLRHFVALLYREVGRFKYEQFHWVTLVADCVQYKLFWEADSKGGGWGGDLSASATETRVHSDIFPWALADTHAVGVVLCWARELVLACHWHTSDD